MRAFVSSNQDTLVHAEVNISQSDTREFVQAHHVRAVPSYRLIDPQDQKVLYEQVGGAPKAKAIQSLLAQHKNP